MMSDEKGKLVSINNQDVSRAREDLDCLSSIEEIIDEARNGRMFILVDDEERVDLHLVDERHLDRRDEEREQQRADREEVPVLDELAVEVDQPAVHRLHAPRQLVDVRLQLVRVELRVRLLVGHVRGALRLDLRAQHLHLRGRRRGDPAALPRRRRRGPARELVVVEALHAHCTGRGAREIRDGPPLSVAEILETASLSTGCVGT